nr:MAG TPA: hypothetical protein [Caudoviricetes sp.]
MKKSCIQELFPELELKAGDTINGKGERLFSKDIFQGMSFVQDHSGIFVVCIIKKIGPQIIYSMGGYDLNYTTAENIDYNGKGFESCLFYRIPDGFRKTNNHVFF